MKKRNIVLGVVIFGAICGFMVVLASFILIPAVLSLAFLFSSQSISNIGFAGLFASLLRFAPWFFFSAGGFMSMLLVLALTDKKDNPFKVGLFMLCSKLRLK